MPINERSVTIPLPDVALDGSLAIPEGARAVVLFAHGSGSSRHSPRNRAVARALREAGLATLLIDLLTRQEEEAEAATGHLRFDVDLLGTRLVGATDWLLRDDDTRGLRIGYFGASTGAAGALVAAAARGDVRAVVSRGGRPDLAGDALGRMTAATLLIVGGRDPEVLALNRAAYRQLRCERRLEVVPGATHLFEEPGTLEAVAALARAWFLRHLATEAVETTHAVPRST